MVIRNKVFSEEDTNGHDFYGYIFESCKFTGITLKFIRISKLQLEKALRHAPPEQHQR